MLGFDTYLLVSRQRCTMYLHAGRSFWRIFVVDFVQAKHLPGGTVELIVIDLQRRKRGIKGKLDI